MQYNDEETSSLLAAWRVVTPINQVWRMMLRRCENPEASDYPRWGGRGIRVHPPWHDFEVFLADVLREIGPRPEGAYASGTPKYSLDRKDNDGHYEPGNVRWATAFEQVSNRRPVRKHQIEPGQRFGRLTVLREIAPVSHGRPLPSGSPRLQRAVEVRCGCGALRVLTVTNLVKVAAIDKGVQRCWCSARGRVRG